MLADILPTAHEVGVLNGRVRPGDVVAIVGAGPIGLADDLGADVATEAVGFPETFELTVDLVRPGGHVANIGVHGAPATLHLEKIWIRNLTITTGLVDTSSTPTLLTLVKTGQLATEGLVTHRFALDEFENAYDVFARAADTGALKVVLTRSLSTD